MLSQRYQISLAELPLSLEQSAISHRSFRISSFLKICSSITGMGFHIAQSLALKGAKVYVSARSSEKANQAIELMQKNNPSLANSGLLCPLPLELSDLQSVGAVARDFAFQEKRLDILVNNAAVYVHGADFYTSHADW